MTPTSHELPIASVIGSDDSEIAGRDAIGLSQIGPGGLFLKGSGLCFFVLGIRRFQI